MFAMPSHDFTSTPNLKVRIFFSHDYGDSWEQIAQLDKNPGAFAWHVPIIDCDAANRQRKGLHRAEEFVGGFVEHLLVEREVGDPAGKHFSMPWVYTLRTARLAPAGKNAPQPEGGEPR